MRYECNANYTLRGGSAERTCDDGGWTGSPPLCEQAVCKESPQNVLIRIKKRSLTINDLDTICINTAPQIGIRGCFLLCHSTQEYHSFIHSCLHLVSITYIHPCIHSYIIYTLLIFVREWYFPLLKKSLLFITSTSAQVFDRFSPETEYIYLEILWFYQNSVTIQLWKLDEVYSNITFEKNKFFSSHFHFHFHTTFV